MKKGKYLRIEIYKEGESFLLSNSSGKMQQKEWS